MEAPEVEAPAAALGAEKGLECLAAPCLAPTLGAACALAGAASPLAGAASALAGAACALASSTFLGLLDALQK